ncbi:MAG: protein kinase [Phototrophicaceae bacterium]
MSDELVGKIVSGYEILHPIGEGGMATVYLAKQQSMNRQVAIKVLPKHFVKDDTYMERFRREVDIASKLEHRNIIPVYDYGEYEGQPFIVMRYMHAGSLDDVLQNSPLNPDQIYQLLSQIAPALDYAHSKGVLHRDLKPSNVLMDDDGGAFLTDFGIARVVGDNSPGLTTQGVVGTPSYMSPEQAQGKELDGRSDIYALGVMLFEMATGRRPFENDTPYSIAVMQVTEQPPMPRNLNPNISSALEIVILKALKKSRDERYQTGIALTEALKLAMENPQAVHDTEPRLQMSSYQEILADEPTKPPSKPKNQVAAYAPSPISASRPIVPPPSSLRSKIRKRRSQSPLFSALIGGSIGCGMLGIITAGIFLAYSLLLTGDTPNNIQETDVDMAASSIATEVTRAPNTLTDGSAIPTLDPTNEAARATLLSRATDDAATPPAEQPTLLFPDTQALVFPVGAAGTPELISSLQSVSGRIIFADERGEDNQSLEVISINFVNWTETQLTQDPFADNMYPIASPDGRWIAFQSNRDGNFEIYIVNPNGGQLQRMTFNDVTDRLPAWSPDGEWIIYSSETETGIFALRRVRISDRVDELVLDNGLYNGHARYSADGRYIVFTMGASRQDAGTWEIAQLDTATGIVTLLTDNALRDASPVFSPDGTRILYITFNLDNQTSGIAEMNRDGSDKRILFDSDGVDWAASYSPDGDYIVFTSNITGQDQLYLMTADGQDVQQITTTGGNYASWIP